MAARDRIPPDDFRIAPAAAAAMRAQIRLAGGREVTFVCSVNGEGRVLTARVVARGTLSEVLALPGIASRGEMLIHNHPSGWLEPSRADLAVAAQFHDAGVGFGIIDNEVTDLYVVTEVPAAKQTVVVAPERVAADFAPGGALARGFARYEARDGQLAMALDVLRTYTEGGTALIEAGTGIGKSMAYLIPALRWAAANNARTIVSTNTILLQEQLVGKDLPLLASLLDDQPVRFALLKGWSNYVCLQRVQSAQAASASLFEPDVAEEFRQLVAWTQSTDDGSRSGLPFSVRPDVWDEVVAESDLCARAECPFYEPCFLFKARRAAAAADVVVVNHALLLADVAVRRQTARWDDAAVLPPYEYLVVDEGHHLEDAAANNLGASLSNRGVTRLLNRLERRGRGSPRGLFVALEVHLGRIGDALSVASLDLLQNVARPTLQAARAASDQLFEQVEAWLAAEQEVTRRITAALHTSPVWTDGLERALGGLTGAFSTLEEQLRIIEERLGTEEADDALRTLLREIRSVRTRLVAAGETATRALRPAPEEAPTVRWAEVRARPADAARAASRPSRTVLLYVAPVDVAPILREDLFKRVASTVITSATLTTSNDFTFLQSRLGLDGDGVRVQGARYPSPFDYERHALLALPSDIPDPSTDARAHFAQVLQHVRDLAAAADGGVFVLATSHRDVRALAAELRRDGGTWPLLVHGEAPRAELLARFKDSGRAILLGTSTFWEGVDVPGDALRALLITRLPFRVPTEPLVAAQTEAIEARGGNPFQEYQLPTATLRLKQGVGRLIRTATDRGVIVLDDPRVHRKFYGAAVLRALPPATRQVAPWATLCDTIRAFYAGAPVSS